MNLSIGKSGGNAFNSVNRVDDVDCEGFEVDFSVDDLNSEEVAAEIRSSNGVLDINYKKSEKSLQAEMNGRILAGEPHGNPSKFLKFLAKNTNPNKEKFSFYNFLSSLKNFLKTFRSDGFLLQKNCVHCARAVDQTLAQMLDRNKGDSSECDLFQVDRGEAGELSHVCGMDQLTFVHVNVGKKDEYIDALKDVVKEGGRSIISVPVAKVDGKYKHAMNVVNMGPDVQGGEDRVFVVCGQSGRIFDLSKYSDTDDFFKRYGNMSSDSDYIIHTPVKGRASSVVSAAGENIPGDPVGSGEQMMTALSSGYLKV